jgi:arylsulfatase A-like enzyme
VRRPLLAAGLALATACAAARCDERGGRAAAPEPVTELRLLDRIDAWTIASPWSPRPRGAPERGRAPAFRAEFEEGLAPGMSCVDATASFLGMPPLRPGTRLAAEPPPRVAAEAAADGRSGLRFEHAAGAAFVTVAVAPDLPCLLSCRVRRGVVPAALDASGDAALARHAQVGTILVLELNEAPPAGTDYAALLASFGARRNALVATHVVPSAAARGEFGESRLLFKSSVFTHALAITLVAGDPGWWALPESAHPDASPPPGAVDFDALRLFELRARDYLPVQSSSEEDDLPQPPHPDQANDGFARKVKLLGDVRRALLAPAGTTASVPVRLPRGRFRIAFSYGVLEEARASFGRVPMNFVARLERDGALPRDLMRASVTASASAGERAWHEWSGDETGDGGTARLVLSAESEGGDDVAVFGEPVVAPLAEPDRLPSPAKPPLNVVLVSGDTLRSDRLGCYGYARSDGQATSPSIDRLAAESLRFADARAVAPFTLPSHATILTGLAPRVHRVVRNGRRLQPDVHPLLAVEFARAGYATAAFTGGAFLSYEHGFHHGFDRYSILDPFLTDEDPYREAFPRPGDRAFNDAAHATCDRRAIERWIDAQSGRPFFLFVHTYVAHNYHPPKAVERRFVRGDVALLGRDRDLKRIDLAAAAAGIPVPDDVARVASDLYDGAVAAADEAVGELLESLRARGLLERTVVALVSDHGEEFGEHGGLLHGRTLYEEVLRVPLLLRAPGVAPAVVGETVDQCDVAPTLRALAGLPAAPVCDGVDLLQRVAHEDFRSAFVAEVSAAGLSRRRALVVGGAKLVENPATRFEEREYSARRPPPWEFFELRADAGERRNLAVFEAAGAGGTAALAADDRQPPRLADLRRAAERMRAAANEERARVVPDREALTYRPSEGAGAQLRALAYTLAGDASSDEEGDD